MTGNESGTPPRRMVRDGGQAPVAGCNGSTPTRLFQGLHITRAAVAERWRPVDLPRAYRGTGQKRQSHRLGGSGCIWTSRDALVPPTRILRHDSCARKLSQKNISRLHKHDSTLHRIAGQKRRFPDLRAARQVASLEL